MTSLKLGVAILLTAKLCGSVPAAEYVAPTVERIPAAVRLWVERYGVGATFGNAPGTKLYLLLQAAMADAGVHSSRSTVRALVPANLPRITTPAPNECWADRLRRYHLQARFLGSRLRFHVIEGLRYLREAIIWSRGRERPGLTSAVLDVQSQNKEVTIR
jgi:hypothetical protein